MISIRQLIYDSKPEIVQRWPKLSNLLIKLLQWVIKEHKFHTFSEQYPDARGLEFADQVMAYTGFGYNVDPQQRAKIPAYGPVVIVANHPIGSLDGLAIISLVASVRPDVKILANEILGQLEPLTPVMIPVKVWGSSKRKQLDDAKKHLQHGLALIVFPAGKVSRLGRHGILDGPWKSGFLRLAQAQKAPVLPIHISGKNSIFFYTLSVLAPRISTLWLVRELFKQQGNNIKFSIGDPVSFSAYNQPNFTISETCQHFKHHTYLVGDSKPGLFATDKPIAPPEGKPLLRKEIQGCEFLGNTPDKMSVYLYCYEGDCSLIRELGRLRELSFRTNSEGTGKPRDLDDFDHHYQQLILWSEQNSEMVGAYRLRTGLNGESLSTEHLYSAKLFEFEPTFTAYRKEGLELGRSFVQPKYWNRRSLDYLWYALGAFLRKNQQIRYLFGPVTLPATYPTEARELLVHFYSTHFSASENLITAKTPYQIDVDRKKELDATFPGKDYKQEFIVLKKQFSKLGVTIPTLFKQYTEAVETGGVQFPAFNNGSGIGDGITGFIIVDLHKMTAGKRKRYIGE